MASANRSVPVLCYHQVSPAGDITPDTFEGHLRLYRELGYETISAMHLYRHLADGVDIPEKAFVITFDDCYLDNWLHALPLLERYGYTGVFFCITGFLHDTPARTTENAPVLLPSSECYRQVFRDGNREQFMSLEEIYTLVKSYSHEVYSHSVSHLPVFRDMEEKERFPEKDHWSMYALYDKVETGTPLYKWVSALSEDGLIPEKQGLRMRNMEERIRFCRDQMKQSKRDLEELLERECPFFCWPFGGHDPISMEVMKECGYLGSFTLDRGPNLYGKDPLYINRIEIKGSRDQKWLKSRLSTYSSPLRAKIFSRKKKF
ncbi:polysaccharide deacetylase family protein [Limisalsivibrio acetivorans]|uniref:polysaccharide deacetylase family protein n=1 Tax=Limisalsivibrio acetivorans TaxID=1304888 RepID=UPI0003B34756|nr:polysaccharide deacetylase family protein [Limisalsivibrio acetivorans]